MLYEVAIIEEPTKKEIEESGSSVWRLVFGPKCVMAADAMSAGYKVVRGEPALVFDVDRSQVIIRPFVNLESVRTAQTSAANQQPPLGLQQYLDRTRPVYYGKAGIHAMGSTGIARSNTGYTEIPAVTSALMFSASSLMEVKGETQHE